VSGVILNLTRAHVRLKEIVAKQKIKFAGECHERMQDLLLSWKSKVLRSFLNISNTLATLKQHIAFVEV
jgi:hypothetical protein